MVGGSQIIIYKEQLQQVDVRPLEEGEGCQNYLQRELGHDKSD